MRMFPDPCVSGLACDGGVSGDVGFDGVHIRCCGNDYYWFRPYGGSLWKSAKVTKTLSPLTYGPSPRLRVPSLRSCSVGPPPSAIHGRGRLPRHPCRGAHCAEPALGLPTGQIKIKIKSQSQNQNQNQNQSQSKATGAVPTLIVPTLCVGMHPVTLCVTIAQDSSLASTAGRGASPAAFPRGAWERSVWERLLLFCFALLCFGF